MISEANLNDSFPIGKFLINSFQTSVLVVQNGHVGGILLYIRYITFFPEKKKFNSRVSILK